MDGEYSCKCGCGGEFVNFHDWNMSARYAPRDKAVDAPRMSYVEYTEPVEPVKGWETPVKPVPKSGKILEWFVSKFEARQETNKLPERGPKLP